MEAVESGAVAGPSTPLLDRLDNILASSSTPAQKAAVLKELRNTLEADSMKLDRGTEEVESTLFFDPFPIFLSLGDLMRSDEEGLRSEARACLDQLAQYSSAKEMVMAIGERFAQLGPPEDNDDDSDESEDQDDGNTDKVEPWDGDGAVRELVDLIRLYGKVLPRVKALRPANFLANAIELILSGLRTLLDAGTFDSSDTGALMAGEAFSAILGFVDTMVEGVWISTVRDQCISQLQNLLFCTISWLHTSLSAGGMADRIFLRYHPRHRIPSRSVASSPDLELVWQKALITCTKVSLDVQTLLATATNRSQGTDKSSTLVELTYSIGSFILLVHLIESNQDLHPSSLAGKTPSELLSSTLPLLMVSFVGAGTEQGKSQVGQDEALFWVWWCVRGGAGPLREAVALDEGILYPLIDLLCSLAALSPSSSVRFLAFRLISTLVISTTDDVTQLMLLEDLLKESPYDEMKLAGLGLLREVLAGKFDAGKLSTYIATNLLPKLESVILRFEPVDLLSSTPFEMEIGDFCEQFHRSTLDKLSLYYLLLLRDVSNETGIKSTRSIESTNELFLDPLRCALDHWSLDPSTLSLADKPSDGGDQPQWTLQLAILDDSLSRVTDALTRVVSS